MLRPLVSRERGLVIVRTASGRQVLKANPDLLESIDEQGASVMVRTRAGYTLIVIGDEVKWVRPRRG